MPRQTYFAKSNDVEPQWLHVDAEDRVLGRMASSIAVALMGKHRPEYSPHVDCGDYVVVTNARKVVMTGRKAQNRMRTTFSGYPEIGRAHV
jgi:large subunit ribosomal protein L13